MKKITIKKLNEIIYETTLDNGFKIYLYPTKKSKNFYVTLTTRFGARDLKFKRNNKIYNVIPGTAHFLEHKVMSLDDYEKTKELEKLGSSPNAYTTYYGTTYNIYGSSNILKNIEILFNIVFSYSVTNKSIDNEKKIIAEEIDMEKDDVYYTLNRMINDNIFINSPYKYEILGSKEDINKIDKKYLDFIYESFYNVSNMFCVITGNFDIDEVNEYIINYISKIKTKKIDTKKIPIKEIDKVLNSYIEKNEDVNIDKVCNAFKINNNEFKDLSIRDVVAYLNIMCAGLFSSTSKFLEKMKDEELIEGNISSMARKYNDYIIIKIITNTYKYNEYFNELDKCLKNINIDEETFIRKKKNILSSYILAYEDIEDVNDSLTFEELEYKYIKDDKYNMINNLNYNDFKKVVNIFLKSKEVKARLYK